MFWGTRSCQANAVKRSLSVIANRDKAFEQLLYDLRSLDRLFHPGAVPVLFVFSWKALLRSRGHAV